MTTLSFDKLNKEISGAIAGWNRTFPNNPVSDFDGLAKQVLALAIADYHNRDASYRGASNEAVTSEQVLSLLSPVEESAEVLSPDPVAKW